MKFSKFSELVNRILSNNHSHRRDMDVTIVVHSPGSIGSTPSVEVQSIHAGFDWDSGKVLIFPSQPLTTLTPEQITDITDSVRKGQSWHAYQEYKKHQEQLEKLSIELDAAKQRIAELESNEVREVGNQFLVVRHPGKTPVIKHCTGDLEEFLRKLIEQDPLVTIDIITHRYYGIGGQWVQDAVEYLHMMSDAGIRIKGE
ncbi:hypothetical protein [Escherichia coli]|uniref:hypothetical protein n=1 Tax=Escherichia coli TaxID=562 RepID=UPI001CD7189B|nr:hypothetical protein [Escherichia coli]MDF8519586.1 hypothetical protein [Escherichia coli]MDH4738018.1 hypothetical protein [Escherichia coli]